MHRVADRHAGQVKAHGQLTQGRNYQVHGIADYQDTGRNSDPGPASESERPITVHPHLSTNTAQSYPGGTDGEARVTKGVL